MSHRKRICFNLNCDCFSNPDQVLLLPKANQDVTIGHVTHVFQAGTDAPLWYLGLMCKRTKKKNSCHTLGSFPAHNYNIQPLLSSLWGLCGF